LYLSKLNNFQSREIYGYQKKGETNLFSTSTFCSCWIRDPRSAIRDPGFDIRDPRSGIREAIKAGSEIRDKHPGSATHWIWHKVETHLLAVDDLLPEVGLGQFDNILPLAGPGIAVAPTTTATAAGTTFTHELKKVRNPRSNFSTSYSCLWEIVKWGDYKESVD
jgi:hypothetical protein